MSEDSFSEVTSESWGSRLGSSIKGIIGGFLALIIGAGLLWWNEGRTVQRTRSLEEGEGNVQTVDVNAMPEGLASNNIVHFSGLPEIRGTVIDSDFGVETPSLSLRRNVEMYQWVEKKESKKEKKLGGGTETKTTYSYVKEWSSSHKKSSNFKKKAGHTNPSSIPYKASSDYIKVATIGSVKLSSSTISSISCSEQLSIGDMKILGDSNSVRNMGDHIYIGPGSNSSPEIGDVKITYFHVPVQDISVVASVLNNTTTAYQAEEGTIHLVECGIQSSEGMFKAAHENNSVMAWILRGLGFALLFAGFRMIFGVVSVLADVLPFLGNIAEVGVGIVAGILAFSLGIVIVAIAWVFFRPILGISLLILAGGLIAFLIFKKKKNVETA